EPDRAVVELQHPARDAGLGLRRGTERDRREIAIRDVERVLHVEKVAQALGRGTAAVVVRAKPRPGLLLQLEQLVDQQLFLALDVAVDRARAHPGPLTDGPQRRAVEAALLE